MGLSTDSNNYIKIISLIIITLFILYILHITIGSTFDVQTEGPRESFEPTIIFEKDATNKILTVIEVYPEEGTFYWPDISVVNGSAVMPYNIIEIGDMITNCEGHLKLEYTRTGKTIWEGDFS
jgi:hypothetical protein